MSKQKLNTVDAIYAALDAGKCVYWSSELYEVKAIINSEHLNKYTVRIKDGIEYQLDCRCTSNYFGGLLQPSEFESCFTIETKETENV